MQSAQATRPQRKAAKKTSAANAAAASSATEDSGVLEDFDQNSSGAEEQVGHEYDHDGNEKEDDSSRESSRSAPKNAERTLSERTRRRYVFTLRSNLWLECAIHLLFHAGVI
eukprot:gb/GECG01015038.1/.p1 GENE.gb/GECG01015038.1/~~gb/GECG01015038.1/.p1  ORF type:complete len:112 (+),score=21.32 gb/GECG01015038.1/:1-336(+)